MPLFMFISGFLSKPLDTKKLIKKLSYFLCPVLFVGIPMSIVFHHTSIDSFWLKPLKYGYWYLICAWILETSNILFEIVFILIISIFISYCSALWGKLLKQSKLIENLVYGKFIDCIIK
jgi:fucose 4-O-acetylase-like acetyltransferase